MTVYAQFLWPFEEIELTWLRALPYLGNFNAGIPNRNLSQLVFPLPSSKVLESMLCWLLKNNLEAFLFFSLLENNLNSIEVSVP